MWRRGVPVVALTLAGLGLLACGGDDADTTAAPTTQQPAVTDAPAVDDTAQTDDDAAGTNADGPGEPTGPNEVAERRPGCETLPETADGVYTVSDAGEIQISSDGDTVSLVETRPAAGWTATGDTEDDSDEVEVYFRRDGREVEFEAELDDGRLEVEVCDR